MMQISTGPKRQSRTIPFHAAYVDDRIIPYLARVVHSGKLSGDGPTCRNAEAWLRDKTGIAHALLTTSCTHALEMTMMLLNLQPGDEVIVPSFTFVSTANAILRGGGVPVFCDIDPDTLTMDPTDVARRITPKTRALFPVHYAGVAADMDPIIALAKDHGLSVIEDAAQGLAAKYKGRWLGTIGDMGAYSFHDTKNVISGEGGAFLTNREDLARRAEILREKGTNRANFIRGQVDKYTWVDEGSSFVLSDLLAAVLQYQFDIIQEIHSGRETLYNRYMAGLADLEADERLRLPVIPDSCTSNYHIFHILLKDEPERNTVLQRLKERGVQTTFHYIPLHSAPFGSAYFPPESAPLPVTEQAAGSLLRLPLYPGLSLEDADYVIESLHDILR